jgi:serine phosphatase RsbU (regulator of sigma subunit)
MEVQIGVAKIRKYATSESGDTLEIIERPGGGLSVVLADGQRSGKSAKHISSMVVRKVISLLAEGVRDGAAARAAADYLFHERKGKVLATLNILSVDLATQTLVVSRNNPAPAHLVRPQGVEVFADDCSPVGAYRNTRPVIREVPLEPGLSVLVYTDGIATAGERFGESFNVQKQFIELLAFPQLSTQEIADQLLTQAVALEQGRPIDDISVVVLRVVHSPTDMIRRMSVSLPIN